MAVKIFAQDATQGRKQIGFLDDVPNAGDTISGGGYSGVVKSRSWTINNTTAEVTLNL